MTLIYLIAGESSGDVLGARLMAALRARPAEDEPIDPVTATQEMV